MFSVQNKCTSKIGICNASPSPTAGYYLFVMCSCKLINNYPILIYVIVASNVERLRDFIKHVYVDKRYAGERSYDKPPRVKTVRIFLLFYVTSLGIY